MRRGPLFILLGVGGAALVALIAVLAVVVVRILPTPIDTSDAPVKRPLWSKPLPAGFDPERSIYAVWVVGDTVVHLIGGGLTGFDLASGERAWSTAKPCGVVGQASDGSILAWGRIAGQCRELQRIDAATGKVVQRTDLRALIGRSASGDDLVSVSEAGERLVLLATGLADGDQLLGLDKDDPTRARWRVTAEEGCSFQSGQESAKTVLVVTRCGTTSVASYDTATGKRNWRSQAVLLQGILDTSPPVLLTAGARPDVVVLDETTGKVDTRIAISRYRLSVDPLGAVVANGVVLVEGSQDDDEAVFAFDLSSGKKLWHRIEEDFDFSFLGGQARAVYAIADDTDEERPDAVLRFSPRDGETAVVASLQPGDLDVAADGSGLWTGRYLVAELGGSGPDRPERAPLVYG